MTETITPKPNCSICGGQGTVPGDSVPYPFGSGFTRLPDEYCDCVIEQLVDDDADTDLKIADEVVERERLAAEAEAAAERACEEAAAAYWASQEELPQSSLCPHGVEVTECNPCLIAGDLAYDAARERR